jgi:hypothetical protein
VDHAGGGVTTMIAIGLAPLAPLALAPIALAADAWIAVGIAVVAALWLLRRAVRAMSARGGAGCGCATSCGPKGPAVDDLRRAAARGAGRVNRSRGATAR